MSLRVSPFSPSQTIAFLARRALGVLIDAVVGEVRLAPNEPPREGKSPRAVEHLLVRLNHLMPRNRVAAPQNHSGSLDRALAQLGQNQRPPRWP